MRLSLAHLSPGVDEQFVGLGNYKAVLSDSDFWHSVWVTVKYAVISLVIEFIVGFGLALATAVLVMAVSVPAGYALTFLPVKRQNLWLILILLASMLPPIVVVVPLFQLWHNLNLLDTPTALIFTYTAMNIPFTIWLLRGFMVQIPRELYESARVDGAGHLRTLVGVIMPVLRAGMAAAAIFVVIWGWNELLFAVFFTTSNRTAPAGIVATLISDRGIN